MKFTSKKIQDIFKLFSMSLEQRDHEDMKLYGWKGGQIRSYRSRRLDTLDDREVDEDREE